MPVGPYKTFADCVRAQKRKGHDDESARKICGKLEKQSSEKSAEEETDGFTEEPRAWGDIRT